MPKYRVTISMTSHEDIEVEVEEGLDAQGRAEKEAEDQAWYEASSPFVSHVVSSELIA